MNLSDDPIHDWLYHPIPEKLWHYTSVQGFQGIITSGNIYATDVRFLNDSEEFIHARKVANDLVNESPEFGDLDFPLRFALTSLVQDFFESDFLDPNRAQFFVASFTDSEDDLSQWRGYSHGTYGVSVAFDLRRFRPPVESDSAVTFAPCVYADDQKRELIQRSLQCFLETSQKKWTNTRKESLKQLDLNKAKPNLSQITQFTCAAFDNQDYKAQQLAELNRAWQCIYRLSGLFKHRAFHHEKEWRFVLPISPHKDKTNLIHPIRFRSTTGSLIPYIEFPLGMVSISEGLGVPPTPVLPVCDVMLGPGASRDAQNAAQAFLESKSIKIIPRLSDVPYRQV